jgi:2-keto-3-deoxy-L-rhamnonate aldolase RhmA
MPVRMNRMKQKLRQGQPVFGGLLPTPEPTLAEVLVWEPWKRCCIKP